MKAGGREVKVLPRVLFEGWSLADFMDIFADLEKMETLGGYMAQQLKVSDLRIFEQRSYVCMSVCLCV